MKPTIRKPTESEVENSKSWPIWEKVVCNFAWEYTQKESCLILEGEVEVTNEDGEIFTCQEPPVNTPVA